ncbi:MAG TPA: flagellar basal body rod protein FlgB [Chloroflexota bacterium]|jgi:flagellar basal-body rod protein FlgB|nr:flagellar basal body rod protein FlgB [Chloroflexota bacterium]
MPNSSNVNFSSADSYIRAAMGGLTARQRAIANNVANVDTPNFKTSEVHFEDALKTALGKAKPNKPVDQTALNSTISHASLSGASSTRGDGNNVDIDREMEMLGEANLTYSALTQVMSTRIGILRNVVSGR